MLEEVGFVLACAVAYGVGGVHGVDVLSKAEHGLKDVRSVGSGNPGATNVTRLHGWQAGARVLAWDASKAFVVVALARCFGVSVEAAGWLACLVALGHCFPLGRWTSGGKGVATALGGMLAACPPLAAWALVVWGGVLGWRRYVSLASMVAAFAVAGMSWWFDQGLGWPMTALGLLVMLRHRVNLQRLLDGQEGQVVWRQRTERAA